MKSKYTIYPLLTTMMIGSANVLQAAITVTDHVLTVPTLGVDDTGYIAPSTNQRFGWDTGEGFTQSFTVANAGNIGSIYLGYNAFDPGHIITLTLFVNGVEVESGIVLNGDNFSGDSVNDGNNNARYWMEFDLSSENVSVNAGTNTFSLLATAESGTGTSWAFAPRLNQGGNPYSGGAMTQIAPGNPYNPPANSDVAFAVTVIPEPSAALLGGLGLLTLLRRRR